MWFGVKQIILMYLNIIEYRSHLKQFLDLIIHYFPNVCLSFHAAFKVLEQVLTSIALSIAVISSLVSSFCLPIHLPLCCKSVLLKENSAHAWLLLEKPP